MTLCRTMLHRSVKVCGERVEGFPHQHCFWTHYLPTNMRLMQGAANLRRPPDNADSTKGSDIFAVRAGCSGCRGQHAVYMTLAHVS